MDLRNEGLEALRGEDWLEAGIRFGMLVEGAAESPGEDPSFSARDRFQYAMALRKLGDLQGALAILTQLLPNSTPPLSDEIRTLAMKTYLEMGDQQKLKAAYENIASNSSKPNPQADEGLFYAALIDAKLGKTESSISSLRRLMARPGYSADVAYLLGQLLRDKGQNEEAIRIWETAQATFQAIPGEEETQDRLRLALGRILLTSGSAIRAANVFGRISLQSHLRDEASMGRGYATMKQGGPNRALEALVYFGRIVESDPHSILGVQARLLSSQCYRDLQVPKKAEQSLRAALSDLGKIRLAIREVVENGVDGQRTDSLEKFYSQKSRARMNTLADRFLLQMPASLEYFPKAFALEKLRSKNEGVRTDLGKLATLLARPDFNPYWLANFHGDGQFDLVQEKFLERARVNDGLAKAHRETQRRVLLFAKSRQYAKFLASERKWANASRTLLGNALSEKIKTAENSRAQIQTIFDYFIEGNRFREPKEVHVLREKIDLAQRNLFLEDRQRNQVLQVKDRISNEQKKVEDFRKMSAKFLTPKEQGGMEKTRAAVAKRVDTIAAVERSFEFQRAEKNWKNIQAVVLDTVDNPAVTELQGEIQKAKSFLDKVQEQDEAAGAELVGKLDELSEPLFRLHRDLDRRILLLGSQSLRSQTEGKLEALASVKGQLREVWLRGVRRELLSRNKLLTSYESLINLELAKVLDSSSFSKGN